ncbi:MULTISPECIES: M23 family metallopeptidase [Bacillales]|uniref:SH3 domain-containing protein n=1 Tax=Lacicoccus qingdaonensis TaxID=576118 RepID=A0A1G9E9P0_9BACL|nr:MULTISPECIES: M23 family metallopeptidase [Salinicoccus]SDK72880.1 SH3 domain-containing protein [Salinicoccus qingdaonensis]
MNPIDYLISQGFRVTSDPEKYASGVWGKRDYTVNGYNYDSYCGGYHRAYDLSKYHLAPVPSVCDGVVTAGTRAFGNFGGTVVIANKDIRIQVIYGHLSRNIPVKIGRKVRRGDTVGYQSNTNYQGVSMNSHLHIQFQNYGYIADERDFVCSGIDPLKINVVGGGDAWLWTGKFRLDARINVRDSPGLAGRKTSVLRSGVTVSFDKLYEQDGHWWLRIKHQGATRYIAAGKWVKGITFSKSKLWGRVLSLNTSGGKE